VWGILPNSAMPAGNDHCTRVAPAGRRESALRPIGAGISHAPRPEQDWIEVPVPPIISADIFARVQASWIPTNRARRAVPAMSTCCTRWSAAAPAGWRAPAARSHPATATTCRGRTDLLRAAEGRRCTARYIPAGQPVTLASRHRPAAG
jgi:hypothetical protein